MGRRIRYASQSLINCIIYIPQYRRESGGEEKEEKVEWCRVNIYINLLHSPIIARMPLSYASPRGLAPMPRSDDTPRCFALLGFAPMARPYKNALDMPHTLTEGLHFVLGCAQFSFRVVAPGPPWSSALSLRGVLLTIDPPGCQ